MSVTKEKTAEEKVAAKRKADFVAENLSEYPKYVAKWFKAPWYPIIRQDPAFYSFLNHKTLPKEFAESYAAYKQVKECIKKSSEVNTSSPLAGFLESALQPVAVSEVPPKDVLIIDLCSGKGFLSILMNFKFPNAHILMIDNMKKINLEHLEKLPRISFWLGNVTSPSFIDDLRVRTQDYKAVICIGIHLCGILSEHFLEAFHMLPNASCMVLSPCCISKKKTELLEKARVESLDSYELWTDELFKMIQASTKEIKKLPECASEKNNFLIACK
jgi:hypothetical protein